MTYKPSAYNIQRIFSLNLPLVGVSKAGSQATSLEVFTGRTHPSRILSAAGERPEWMVRLPGHAFEAKPFSIYSHCIPNLTFREGVVAADMQKTSCIPSIGGQDPQEGKE